MTTASFIRRVTYWQKKLKPLRLEHWDIEVEAVDEPSDSVFYSAKAAVTMSSHYDTVYLEVCKAWLPDAEPGDIDKVIIHELIHVAMRDFDDAIHRVEDVLGVPARGIWKEELRHERESLVEQLARTLYLAYEGDMWYAAKS